MEQEITEFLRKSENWQQVENTLVGNWKLTDFAELRKAVGKLCDLADELNHHPTVTYGYNTLRVETTTHDAGSTITTKDIELAKRECNKTHFITRYMLGWSSP